MIDLLRRAMDPEKSAASRAGLSFRLDVQPVDVWVDGDRILQVMGNLIRNAIKFSEKGGEIRLGARATSETEVTFEVQDQGAGIPEGQAGFDFRALPTGRCFGFALARRDWLGPGAMPRHYQSAWGPDLAKSSPGTGSTFYFTVDQYVAKRKQNPKRSQR